MWIKKKTNWYNFHTIIANILNISLKKKCVQRICWTFFNFDNSIYPYFSYLTVQCQWIHLEYHLTLFHVKGNKLLIWNTRMVHAYFGLQSNDFRSLYFFLWRVQWKTSKKNAVAFTWFSNLCRVLHNTFIYMVQSSIINFYGTVELLRW